MKKIAVRILFAFRNNLLASFIPEVKQFVNTSATIAELNVGTPALPSVALNIINDMEAKYADIVSAEAKVKLLKGEYSTLSLDLKEVLEKMQNNAVNYIGDDEAKAALLEATVKPLTKKRNLSVPDRPNIKLIKDTKNSGSVKILLEKKPAGSISYQVRYTLNRGNDSEEVILYPEVFLSVVKLIIEGLPVGQTVYFEVRANNSNGHGDWSGAEKKSIN